VIAQRHRLTLLRKPKLSLARETGDFKLGDCFVGKTLQFEQMSSGLTVFVVSIP